MTIAALNPTRRRAAILAAALTIALPLTARAVVPEKLLSAATAAYDAGIASSDPVVAANHFRRAVDNYTALLAAGHDNPGLHYNLANTHARLGQWGHAIRHYRRAAQLAPRAPDIAANLALARQKLPPAQRFEPPPAWVTALQPNTWLAPAEHVATAAVLTTAGWLIAAFAWRRPRRGSGLLIAAVPITLGGWLALDLYAAQSRAQATPAAVVVDTPRTLRNGPGPAYEPVLTEPLGPGVELRAHRTQGDWVAVRFRDIEGWLPRAGVSFVAGPPHQPNGP
jgi:tetratricopeptide (TPR) repeat protein